MRTAGLPVAYQRNRISRVPVGPLTLAARAAKMRRGRGGTAAATSALWRRRRTDGDQRCIRRVCFDAAGHLPFTDKGRRIARRTAIGAHQHFVAAARRRAATDQAVQPNNANGRTGRTLFALRARLAGRPDRPNRSGGAGIAFGTGRTLRSGITLRTFAATGKSKRQHPNQQQISDPHFWQPVLGRRPITPHIETEICPVRINKLCRPQ